MSRWSGRRGQIEPLAAIAAVFLVGAGLAVYAGVLGDVAFDGDGDRAVADTALDSVERAVERGGVVEPDRLGTVRERGPAGYTLNATLEMAERRWHVGPTATAAATNASERVSVETEAGRVRPGRLVVRVWT
jgi:hypothetical protein